MDLEIAKAIKNSVHWHSVEEELDRWIQGSLAKIKTCTPDELTGIQARIAAREECKRLPEVVIKRG